MLETAREQIISKNINPECFATVVIPVRNEAENISHTLRSLINQVDFQNRPLDRKSFEIVVLVNNCSDDSAAIVEAFAEKHSDYAIHFAEACLATENANIGYVRRWLMNEAETRLKHNKFGRGVILTTDGDTCAAPNWIAANLNEIKNGADAVGGRILIKSQDLRQMNHKARRFHLLDTGYRLLAAELEARLDFVAHDYLPRHHQHFNGSFAVTTQAFRQAGGVPQVAFLEDVAFFQSLMRIDARFRHSPLVRVETSSRTTGRTELGLSTQINEWTVMGENGDTYFVESAEAIAQRIYLRGILRKLHGEKNPRPAQISMLAGKLLISPKVLETELARLQTFGSLLEKVHHAQHDAGEWKRKYPLTCVSRAINDLRKLLEIIRRENHSPERFFVHTSSR